MTAGFFNTTQLCHRYSVSVRTLENWRKKRGFPKPAITSNGAQNLYTLASIESWEAKQMEVKNQESAVA